MRKWGLWPETREQKGRLKTCIKWSLAEVKGNFWFERLKTNCSHFRVDLWPLCHPCCCCNMLWQVWSFPWREMKSRGGWIISPRSQAHGRQPGIPSHHWLWKVFGLSLNDGASKWETCLQGLVISVPWPPPVIDDDGMFSLGIAGKTL